MGYSYFLLLHKIFQKKIQKVHFVCKFLCFLSFLWRKNGSKGDSWLLTNISSLASKSFNAVLLKMSFFDTKNLSPQKVTNRFRWNLAHSFCMTMRQKLRR